MLRKSIEEHQSKHQEGTTPHTQKANAPVVQPDYVPGLNLNHSDSVGVKGEESETNARCVRNLHVTCTFIPCFQYQILELVVTF